MIASIVRDSVMVAHDQDSLVRQFIVHPYLNIASHPRTNQHDVNECGVCDVVVTDQLLPVGNLTSVVGGGEACRV